MTRIVFAHANFPAQFGAFGAWLAERGWEVVFITQRKDAQHPGMRIVRCESHRAADPATHRYVQPLEQCVISGQAFARAATGLARAGFAPDIVMAHSGWGAGMFLGDVWPRAVCVPYFEWYYAWPYTDATPYDSAPQDPLDERARNRVRNAPVWATFSTADEAVCPTRFQASQFPRWMRERLTVIHDGVDTQLHSPGDGGRAILARWGVPPDAEILTSITRGMEPHRGFPETMRAVAALQKRRPRLHALIGGEDRVAYGAQLPAGETWKGRMLAELDLDLSRVHFTGLLPRRDMVDLMRASDVHVYLTVPFVLSWSLLDAMSTGCLIVASDTEPVREFVTDGRTGLLCPMHDWQALAARIAQVLDAPDAHAPLRRRARASIVGALDARQVIYPKKLRWLRRMTGAATPPRRRGRPAG
jgi:glycosyltransferase involved in cell wall biosynthesis